MALGELRGFAERFDAAADVILAVGVLAFQAREAQYFGIHARLLDDERIARCNGFHLRVSERGGVHIFGAAHGCIACHDLCDEAAFCLQRLPHVGIE